MLSPNLRVLAPQDLEDIQLLVIHTVRHPRLRYYFFEVRNEEAARGFLAELAGRSTLAVSTASQSDVRSTYRIHVGLTARGLQALGEPHESLKSFPEEFRQGARARASEVGDTGPSAPEHWTLPHDRVHIVVMLYAADEEVLKAMSAAIETAASAGCTHVEHRDARALEDYGGAKEPGARRKVHFGFVDGISQPTIMGIETRSRRKKHDDDPPEVPPGMFVLGHPFTPDESSNDFSFSITNEPLPEPRVLGYNGTFGALRILEQNCDAFEEFLERNARDEEGREWLAAKMCGRWRNGRPLSLSPGGPGSVPGKDEALNNFDYRPIGEGDETFDDTRGIRCPIGSHVRRSNPRSADVLGRAGHRVRIMRRGMPYGPPHEQGDGEERGMLGLFLGVSLKHQFEFIQKHWINDGLFARGLAPDERDPLVGNTTAGARFTIPGEAGTGSAKDLPTPFVTTKGAVYLFFPSLSALRFLSTSRAGRSTQSLTAAAELEMSDQDRVDSVVANMMMRLGRSPRRDAHPKHHGIVSAKFEVRAGIDQDLAKGLFARSREFDAYIRFSNGSPRVRPDGSLQPDSTPDVRGMAIKLLGVDGRKLMSDERRTHDFVLASHPVFFVRDLGEYLTFLDTPAQHLPRKFPLLVASFQSHQNPLSVTYFSQTPYRLGSNLEVKYKVTPIGGPQDEQGKPDITKEDFLRNAMGEWLQHREARFDFAVQRRPETGSIDDATEDWKTPFTTVAHITIRHQEFRDERHDALAENVSFSPWHCLEEHEPLGSINRARRAVYVQASERRHGNGGRQPHEPDGSNDI